MIRMFASLIVIASVCIGAEQTPPPPIVLPTSYEGHRFFVTPITEDGKQLKLFTDTGGGFFLTSEAAQRLGLAAVAPTELAAHGINLPAEVIKQMPADTHFVIMPKFRADATIPGVITPVGEHLLMPLPPAADVEGKSELFGDGMLGQKWFAERTWTFDYPNRRLLQRAPGDLPKIETSDAAPTVKFAFKTSGSGRRQGNYPRMQMIVDGETHQMLFDTGATTSLTEEGLNAVNDGAGKIRATSFIIESIFDQWKAQHADWRLIEKAEANTGHAMIEARDVTIAGEKIDKVWFTRRQDKDFVWMSQFMDKPIEGAIGGSALHHFRITVDYPNAVAVFERAAK